MANIKIAELQSANLLEELSDADLGAVNGGDGAQFVGSTSGVNFGFANGGGSANATTTSFSNLSGEVNNFNVNFGTTSSGITSPT